MSAYVVRLDLPGVEAESPQEAAAEALLMLRTHAPTEWAVEVAIDSPHLSLDGALPDSEMVTVKVAADDVECPVCRYRAGEAEGHAEWCSRSPDVVSLPGMPGRVMSGGMGESGPSGVPGAPSEPTLVIRPLCPECSSASVTRAFVHDGEHATPALVLLCSACHLAQIDVQDGPALAEVARRLHLTQWRCRAVRREEPT